MTAFSRIGMAEVTRLTRAGRLAEATALLQGFGAADAPRTPAASGATWITPKGAGETSQDSAEPPKQAAVLPGVKGTVLAFRDRLAQRVSIPGLGQRLGTPTAEPVPVPGGARFEERTFANRAGSLTYKVFVPSGFTGQVLPVVVMLHGCTQTPEDFALGTGMNDVAEEHGNLVAYPRQPSSANMQRCWNWFQPGDQRRGGGEPALIAGIAAQVVEEFSADPTRV